MCHLRLFCTRRKKEAIMQDEALQAAFEIKTECDEISRRLLRWHWEQKPGSHSLDALLRHIAQRQKERPFTFKKSLINFLILDSSSTTRIVISAIKLHPFVFLCIIHYFYKNHYENFVFKYLTNSSASSCICSISEKDFPLILLLVNSTKVW